jgi:hypothetical protein
MTGGLLAIGACAPCGLGGLDHYVVVPPSSHTLMVKFSILFEVATAFALLARVGSFAAA